METQTQTNTIVVIHTAQATYDVVTRNHLGRKHIVVPVVMMMEGVHNGSAGPIFHPAGELGRFPGSWDGMPVVIGHPQVDETPVSANSPDIAEREVIGRVYNTHMEGTRLKAEVWLDEERLGNVSPLALHAIRNREPLDVSVGVFTDDDNTAGEWQGEQYERIARNHRPDHLALLPGGEGACSWEDGCGIRLNNKKEGGEMKNKDDPEVVQIVANLDQDYQPEFACQKKLKEYRVRVVQMLNNEMGKRTLVENIQRKLDVMDSDTRVHFLQEVYDDHFVYEVRSQDGTATLYRRGYSVDDNEIVDFDGEVAEVRKRVEYLKVQEMKRTKFNNNNKQTMETETKKTPLEEKVDALIANEHSKWTEDDREFLLTVNEGQFDKLEPVIVEKPVEKKVEVNVLSDEDKQALAAYKAEQKAKRDQMIKEIQTNTEEGTWPDEVLEKMDEDVLKRIHGSVNKEDTHTDYSAYGGGRPPIQDNEEKLLPTGVSETDK